MRITKHSIAYVCILLAVVTLLGYVLRYQYSIYGNPIRKLSIGDSRFRVEVVTEKSKMEKGLGGRKSLCRTCGMLFQFPKEGDYAFWMKDMKLSLDIVWISNDKIVFIKESIPKDSQDIFQSPMKSDRVLELPVGTVRTFGIHEGQAVSF